MAKVKALAFDNGLVVEADAGPSRTWAKSHGTYIAGRAVLDETDAIAAEMEAKWGCGRLRLLVSVELREKFDRQRYLTNQAIWHGDLQAVRLEGARMATAWRALDRAATAAGAAPLDPNVWEVTLSDGTVAAFVPDNHHASRVVGDGRRVNVWTLEEVARVIEAHSLVNAVKLAFPGAKVEQVRRNIGDPLDAVDDSRLSIDQLFPDDEIPF